MLLAAETAIHASGDSSPSGLQAENSKSSVVATAGKLLPEFTMLLKRIEAECAVHGPLSEDLRSATLLAFAQELLAEAAVDKVFPEIAVVNVRSNPREVPVAIATEFSSKLMMKDLRHGMKLVRGRLTSESLVPLHKPTELPPRTIKARTSKSTTKVPVLYWVIAGICVLTAAAIGYALM